MSRHLSSEAGTTMRYVLHEVRTPLAQIMGFSEMLQEEARDRGVEDFVPDLEQIHTSARQLLEFIESVFRPNSGTTAEATSPARAEPAVAGDAPPSSEPALERAELTGSLLVVDDDAINRDQLSRRLTKMGHAVTTAPGGREALLTIETGNFDLVMLDVLMPGMSGLEVLAAVRSERSATELPVIMATALGASEDTVEALRLGANDYVTKPFDIPVLSARITTQLALRRAALEIAGLAQQLEIRNAFIRHTFGRYVSDEVVTSLLDSETGLELSGEMRCISVLMSDLRGFTALTESLTPTQVVSLLNSYLGTMADVIQSHGGTIDEFQGDGILAFFGAPVSQGNDAERAVTAAVAMQLAMDEVNTRNAAAGLPRIAMGIGIATGNAIVGNLGSEKRAKYGAVGSTINLASRIESYSLGGDIFVEDATLETTGETMRVERTREVQPKGFAEPIRIHRVAAIGELELPERAEALTELTTPIPVRFAFIDGKDVGPQTFPGELRALSDSQSQARLHTEEMLPEFSNLRIDLLDPQGERLPGAVYAKVVEGDVGVVHFTTRSTLLDAALAKGREPTS